MKHAIEVSPAAAGRRLDLAVGEALGLSRAEVKALFESGAVRVRGRRPRKGERAEAGMVVEVEVPEEAPALVAQPELPLRVLHEDAHLVAVDKAPGMPSHPLRPGETGTVANALVARYPECAAAGEDPREGGLVHRLDLETSGVLLAARDRATWDAVRALFTTRAVDKRYWALTAGPIAEQGVIDLPLRHRGEARMEPAADGGEPGREAVTEVRVLARQGDLALVEVRILTGVQHQIRAHLAAIGAPVMGDALYGGRPCPGLPRIFLHAHALGLVHPASGETLRVESPLPVDLRDALARVGLAAPGS
ncbi:MAG TPA: RluA family pseudouridine synthase [Myxococcaceae bacterium]|nr:RluA family pseudouridine synthase [Myxococcaceae bacterium]